MISVRLLDARTSFRPREAVEGSVSWSSTDPVRSVAVRLLWETKGEGEPDSEVVAEADFAEPGYASEKEFRLVLPAVPYSFAGNLVSLIWRVEAVLEPTAETASAEIVVSPSGREIRLYPAEVSAPVAAAPPPVSA